MQRQQIKHRTVSDNTRCQQYTKVNTIQNKQTAYVTSCSQLGLHFLHENKNVQNIQCHTREWLFTWLEELEPELRLRPLLLPLPLALPLPELEEEDERPRRRFPPVRVLLRLREWLRERLRDLQRKNVKVSRLLLLIHFSIVFARPVKGIGNVHHRKTLD